MGQFTAVLMDPYGGNATRHGCRTLRLNAQEISPHTEVWESKGFTDFTPCRILPGINFKKTNYSCVV